MGFSDLALLGDTLILADKFFFKSAARTVSFVAIRVSLFGL